MLSIQSELFCPEEFQLAEKHPKETVQIIVHQLLQLRMCDIRTPSRVTTVDLQELPSVDRAAEGWIELVGFS